MIFWARPLCRVGMLSAVVAMVSTQAMAEKYRCDLVKTSRIALVAPVIELEVRKGPIVKVFDEHTKAAIRAAMTAEVTEDTNKRIGFRWSVSGQKMPSAAFIANQGQVVNYFATLQKASGVFRVRAKSTGAGNSSAEGKCVKK